ncbi:YjbQ family protein [Candidatus Beckwithbacteria bacterium]|nr:YjbQ family protein [Candidatus Beckwithbacteria bacterium]
MQIIDKEIDLNLEKVLTSVKEIFQELISQEKIKDGNLVLWVPHEVSSLIQIGWENGLTDDLINFLQDLAPEGKWTKHDEPNTPFRYNFFEHIRTKLIGTVSMTLIVKDGQLILGKYQDLYFYSPVYKAIPQQKIFCRMLIFSKKKQAV